MLGGYTLPMATQAKPPSKFLPSMLVWQSAGIKKPAPLSGGERRLLEISRALVSSPSVLLVDEPSIGLEPRYIDMVFEILADLRESEGKTIVMVEQNAKKGLAFADIGYVLTAGKWHWLIRETPYYKTPMSADCFWAGE